MKHEEVDWLAQNYTSGTLYNLSLNSHIEKIPFNQPTAFS